MANHKKLDVYFLIDILGSMYGESIELMNDALFESPLTNILFLKGANH